ncbi:hypothetical protein GQ54DRAFT_260797 [Martensiomyces pterosporus]|nr:hypothetical protein GQ54DRAFT_260797 [Martensiomyces pterosporus]
MTKYLAVALLTLASVLHAAPNSASSSGSYDAAKCPDPSKCYHDTIRPVCSPGVPCPQWVRAVIACAWNCGNTHLPAECTQRCKPCKAEVCSDICDCEIVCPATGSCTAPPLPSS